MKPWTVGVDRSLPPHCSLPLQGPGSSLHFCCEPSSFSARLSPRQEQEQEQDERRRRRPRCLRWKENSREIRDLYWVKEIWTHVHQQQDNLSRVVYSPPPPCSCCGSEERPPPAENNSYNKLHLLLPLQTIGNFSFATTDVIQTSERVI